MFFLITLLMKDYEIDLEKETKLHIVVYLQPLAHQGNAPISPQGRPFVLVIFNKPGAP